MAADALALARRRWTGQAGRLEVWYLTATCPRTGLGLWLHHELRASAAGKAVADGWAALFMPEGGVAVVPFEKGSVESPGKPAGATSPWFASRRVEAGPQCMRGAAGALGWDLSLSPGEIPPLSPFPSLAWRWDAFPGAQVVPWPDARLAGSVWLANRRWRLDGVRAGIAHIWSHGHPQEWVWLHAVPEPGVCIEVVAARSRHLPLRAAGMLPFVALRTGGRTWPRNAWRVALTGKVRLHPGASWTLEARDDEGRLFVEVPWPPQRGVTLEYADVDGPGPVCTNSECADASIRWEPAQGPVHTWTCKGTAHAELARRL